MNFEVLSADAKRISSITQIRIELPFETICSVPKKPYGGTIRIRYTPGEQALLLEWNSFAEYVRTLRSAEFMAEDLASVLLAEIVEAVHPKRADVEVVVDSAFHLPVSVLATTF